jgi:hypothetical protein
VALAKGLAILRLFYGMIFSFSCASSSHRSEEERRAVLAGAKEFILADHWISSSNGKLGNQEFVVIDFTIGQRTGPSREAVREAQGLHENVRGVEGLESEQQRDGSTSGSVCLKLRKVTAHERTVKVETSGVVTNLSRANFQLLISHRRRVRESELLSVS